ncbi:uncharacterized protein LOC111449903 [Cucurbita moschata]|uniref:Uncharacterized protein LOC111449903 n=1 Tax=Cucurbita moschata TaxID=3662 RepID=A0A6J1G1S4_CUCMO|nr:uncharacterized protein LOC111449903 [Cucurbita moschata]
MNRVDDEQDVFLFNLTTKEFRKLPPSILHYTKSVYKSHYSVSNAVGFGYNSKSRDFKVVRVVEFVHIYDETVPDCLAKVHKKYITLGILNGSIVIFYHPTDVEKVIYIWEMKKDEHDVVSWSKLFTIGPTFGIENPLFVVSPNEVLRKINEKPLLFVSSDELLMQTNEGKLIFYNIKTHRVKPIPIEGPCSEFCATFFDHSLLSVKGGHNVLYEF